MNFSRALMSLCSATVCASTSGTSVVPLYESEAVAKWRHHSAFEVRLLSLQPDDESSLGDFALHHYVVLLLLPPDTQKLIYNFNIRSN